MAPDLCLHSAGEVLGVSELQVEAEEQVQALDPGSVDGDVQQAADQVGVLQQAAGQAGRRQLQGPQQLLHLRGPLLHQAVQVRHGSAVAHTGRWLGPVQRADAIHPAVHGPGIGPRAHHARNLLQLQWGDRAGF